MPVWGSEQNKKYYNLTIRASISLQHFKEKKKIYMCFYSKYLTVEQLIYQADLTGN